MPLQKKIALESFHNIENLLNIEIIEAIDTALVSMEESKAYFYTSGSCLRFQALSGDFVAVNETLESWIDSDVMHQVFSIKFEFLFNNKMSLVAANKRFVIPGFHTLALSDNCTGIYIVTMDTSHGLFGYEVQNCLYRYFDFIRSLSTKLKLVSNIEA